MGRWGARLVAAIVMVAAVGLTAPAHAQDAAANAIQSIGSAPQGAGDLLRIELAQPLAALPQGFAVQSPPRIALDLPPLANATGRNVVEIAQGNVRSVAVAQTGERTRLVVNLRSAASYRAELQGRALLVHIDPAGSTVLAPTPAATPGSPAAEPGVRFASPQNREPQALRDIDFRRGADGAGRIIVSLPSTQVGVDIRQQGGALAIDFLRSSLPPALRRRLDVTDFGTPVQSVTTTTVGDIVRMTVEARGAWQHSAWQNDNQFVVEVRPTKVDPSRVTAGPGFTGEKLSLNFQNIEVRALLQVIADFTNFNIVTSDSVTGNVTLRLKEVPWDQALDIILNSKGLGMRRSGNVLWVAPKDELAAREALELKARKEITELEPVRSQAFQLNYASAPDVARLLMGQSLGTSSGLALPSAAATTGSTVPGAGTLPGIGAGGGAANARILSPRGTAMPEPRTNQLFISDIASKLEEVAGMIALIDVPVRQVLIEARIVEASDTFGRDLGVKLGGVDLRGQRGGVPGYSVGGGNYLGIGTTADNNYAQMGGVAGAALSTDPFFNFAATGTLLGATPASIALALFSPTANRILNLELSALEADGRGKIVSSPRVITADKQAALIEQGEEIPYQVATSSGATSVQFKKASLKLEVTPQITPEGNVIMALDIAKDSRGVTTTAGPAINTKHARTQVLVENGGTVVLGGIFTQEDRTDIKKVPLLGDMPVLGGLFRNTVRVDNKTELLIFITPKVVNDRASVR